MPHSQHLPLFDFCQFSPYKSPKAQDHDPLTSNGMLGSLVLTSDGASLPVRGFPSWPGLQASGTRETTEKDLTVGGPGCFSFAVSQLEDPE